MRFILDENDVDYIATVLCMISAGHALKDCQNVEHIKEMEHTADQVMTRINSKAERAAKRLNL